MNQYVNDFNRTVALYYDDLKRYKPLSRAREKRLIRLSKKGNIKAKNEILESNLKFVFDVAKHYTGRGVSISELISEGNMGLFRAIDKFDEEKGVKFISYAVWWIRQAMLEAIKSKNSIKFVEINQNEDGNGGIKEDDIVDNEYSNDDNAFFLDEDIGKGAETKKEQKKMVDSLIDVLNEREKDIIENYYGLNDNEPLTLLEIGEKYSLTSERVRQIKSSAIRKLRSKALLFDNTENLF